MTESRRLLEEIAALRRDLDRRIEQIDELYRRLHEKDRKIEALRRELTALRATLGWRALERFRTLHILSAPVVRQGYAAVRRTVEVLLDEGAIEVLRKTGHKLGLALRGRNFLIEPRDRPAIDPAEQYRAWLERERRSDADPPAPQEMLERFDAGPVVSLLAVQQVGASDVIRAAFEMLRAQRYPRWELCVAMPATARSVVESELEVLEAGEPRLRTAVAGTEATLADALGVARGAVIGILDPHDVLHPDALLELVRILEERPDVDAVYSDEDVLDGDGRRMEPFFKPDWSPDLLLATNYVVRLGLVRRRLVEAVGGVRADLRGGAAYDLWLRIGEQARGIVRVPKVLYHRRARVPTAMAVDEAAQTRAMECRALEEVLRRRDLDGSVEALAIPFGAPSAFAPRLRLRGRPLVSIIIPTRDKHHFLEQAIHSILERTEYDPYEIIVVDNDSRDPEAVRFLDSLGPPCRVLRSPGVFNFSALNNMAAQHAKGEQLLLLNNDVEVHRPDWLSALLEHAQRPDVGAVGAKLLYPDGRIQHAGVIVGLGGAAGHAFRFWPGQPTQSPRLPDLLRNCSAVTAACMMIPRAVFEQVGGFDERLRVVLNDVDLCLRIREAGYRIVYTPFALLTHYEGASRGRRHPTADEMRFRARWAEVLRRGDPYYNPNLTERREDWSLRL